MEEEKNNIITKSIEAYDRKTEIQNSEMDLINKFTQRTLKKEEVYVFSVTLCDNDIDRQNERFSNDALEKLKKLFIGKTGIMDHDCKSENQTARIFSCKVETIGGKENLVGKPYKRLVARAYMPKTEKNKEIIMQIEAGIKKEVSINCSVENITCSICGANAKKGHCEHIKGRVYKRAQGEVLCHSILENPIDAYEWSFVVVPAQKRAGVIKAFDIKSLSNNGGEITVENIIEKMKEGCPINLDSAKSKELYEILKALKEKAKIGEEYFNELKSEVIKLSKIAQPEIGAKVMESVVEKMSLEELKSFKEAYKKKSIKESPIKPQLSYNGVKGPLNAQFKI